MPGSNHDITAASLADGQLELHWHDGARSRFHPFWLRDNCRCDACGDPAIGYRALRTSAIDADCRPVEVNADGGSLRLVWDDGHASSYPARWLREHAYDDAGRRARVFRPLLWDDEFRRHPPLFDYAAIADDSGLYAALETLRDRGLCLLRGAPAEAGIAEALALRFGYPQENNFGRVQDLRFDPSRRSIAFDVKALKPHTDEPYRASPPGILLFHCITNDQTGAGGSLFVDGFEVAERLRAADPEGFAALCDFPQSFRRHFEGDVDLIAEFPLLSVDEFGNLCGVRINDRVAAPLCIPPEVVDDYYRGLRFLLRQTEDSASMLIHTLAPGDIAIFDNHRVLHGRSDLTIHGQRWLQWVQVERGDLHSSLRILADRLGRARDDSPLMRGAYGSAARRRQR